MDNLKLRQKRASEELKKIFNTEKGVDNINVFIEHHKKEISTDYWKEHLKTSNPTSLEILNYIEFKTAWGENDIEYLDFTLPDDVTQYVLSVHFNTDGDIDYISMES